MKDEDMKRTKPTVSYLEGQKILEFKHQGSPYDNNGIVVYIGTDLGAKPFINPGESGLITVESLTIRDNSKPITAITGRKSVRCVSEAFADQWFTVNFHELEICPTAYSLRHYLSWDYDALRSWDFEGFDGTQWVLIRRHKKDKSLHKKGMWVTWPLKGNQKYYSIFRLRMTGKNSRDRYHLACSGFEIYGRLKYKKGKPKVQPLV